MDRSESAVALQGSALVGDILEHHGIKGMKWGVRSASSKAEEHTASPDHLMVQAAKAKAKSGGVKALSNEELQKIVTRLNLEQQHRNLEGAKPSKFETGHRSVKKIIAVGKTLNEIHNTVNGPVGKSVKTLLKAGAKAA